MNSSLVSVNREDLGTFLAELRGFNHSLSDRWTKLDARWKAASETWRDIKKEQFQDAMEWDVVVRQMQNYLSSSADYEHYLTRLATLLDEYINI